MSSSLLASLFASKIRCDLIFVGIFVCKQDQVWSHLCWHLCSQATSGVSSSLLALLPPVISLMERLQLSPAAAGGDKRNYLRQHSFEKKNPNLYSSPVISKWLQIRQNKYHQTNSPQIVLLLKIGLICPCKSRHRSFSVKMQHLAFASRSTVLLHLSLLSFPPSWRTSVRSLRSVPSSWGQATKCPLKRTGVRNIFSLKKSFLTYIQVLSSSIGTGIAVRPAMES